MNEVGEFIWKQIITQVKIFEQFKRNAENVFYPMTLEEARKIYC